MGRRTLNMPLSCASICAPDHVLVPATLGTPAGGIEAPCTLCSLDSTVDRVGGCQSALRGMAAEQRPMPGAPRRVATYGGGLGATVAREGFADLPVMAEGVDQAADAHAAMA